MIRSIRAESDNKKETIEALKTFRQAYFDLLYENLSDKGEEIINSSSKYPFNKPFNELGIIEWINDIIEKNK
jgi:hypothetical protein